MSTDAARRLLGASILLLLATAARAGVEWSFTELPRASVRYRGEGKVIPQSYVNRYDGATSPVYRLEATQPFSRGGYWSSALWHTGEFGGGNYATERVPDVASGGTYQTDKLNVGFTNVFFSYHRPLRDLPVEALVNFSVVRQIFKRKQFSVRDASGVDHFVQGLDDVNELSAEGIGVGLTGKHGDRFFLRWRADANYYVQIFDAKTDSSAGQVFQAEGGAGVRLAEGLSLELGFLRQYWFLLGQGNRRLSVPGTDGAVISWNRQETDVSGLTLRLDYKFINQLPADEDDLP